MYFIFLGCPGCSVHQSCTRMEMCSTSCGNILSPAFPINYANDIRCVWQISVATDSFIQLHFKYFDIFEMDFPSCVYDYVSIYDDEPQRKQEPSKQFLIDQRTDGASCDKINVLLDVESNVHAL